MKRPDIAFNVYISPIRHLYYCNQYSILLAEGRECLHPTENCPNCHYIDAGFELWGENYYRHGAAANRQNLALLLQHLAKKQWLGHDGQLWGYHFKPAPTLNYLKGEVQPTC